MGLLFSTLELDIVGMVYYLRISDTNELRVISTRSVDLRHSAEYRTLSERMGSKKAENQKGCIP